MLRTASQPRPHIVVLGNHKGGSGKSTVAMHVTMGLMKEGRRVASLDLDYQQRTFSTYIENRRRWSWDKRITLNRPAHYCVDDLAPFKSRLNDTVRISLVASAVASFEPYYDFIIIDTPGGTNAVNVFAHGLAD